MKKYIEKIIVVLCNIIVLCLSFFVFKSRKIVLIGGWFGERFADNSKYLFLYTNNSKDQLKINKVIWITVSTDIIKQLKNEGYEHVYNKHSLKSYWYHLRAKFHIIDQSSNDICSLLSVRSIRVNLWHGIPLKKIGYLTSIQTGKSSRAKFLRKISTFGFWSDQFILAPTEFSSSIFQKAFNVSSNKIIMSGYPRNYKFGEGEVIEFLSDVEKNIIQKIEIDKNDSSLIVGYFPTFRDKCETKLFGNTSLNDLNDFLVKNNSIIYIKSHSADKIEISELSNLRIIPNNVDVYSILGKLDILITDYSSIYHDFLFYEKPIIFFAYDYEYYRDHDRGFQMDYKLVTPGPIITSIIELESYLIKYKDINEYHIDYKEHSKIVLQMIYGARNNLNVKNFYSELLKK